MRTIIVLVLCSFTLFGCASRSEYLTEEYDRLSKETDAVQNELSATMTAKSTADQLVMEHEKLTKRLEELLQKQNENDDKGYFTAKSISANQSPKKILEELSENYTILSDKMDEFRKEKGRIVEEQMLAE